MDTMWFSRPEKLLNAYQFAKAMGDVLVERERQDVKWGEQNHHPLLWNAILAEEVGEVAKALNVAHWGKSGDWSQYREELIQVAAVAIAAVETLDRLGVIEL